MEQNPEDPLNNVLLDARRSLQAIQNTMNKPETDYNVVLAQLQATSTKYKNEAENLISDRFSESNLLPMQAPVKQRNIIQQIRATSPKEYRPFKTNRAMELRKKYVSPIHLAPALPKLKSEEQHLSAMELIQKGLISEYDDIRQIVPAIDTSVEPTIIPMFGTIQIDIPGAAKTYKIKKEKQQKEIQDFSNSVLRTLNNTPAQASTPTRTTTPQTATTAVEEEAPERSLDSKLSKRTVVTPSPRIYEDLQDEFAYQTLLVVRGKIARETPDFESFQRTNNKFWNRIDSVLGKIEEFCEMYEIQFAEIDGRKLGEAARLAVVTFDDVHRCLVNVDDYINRKQNEAAITIQRNVKIFIDKIHVKERKEKSKAAYKIQTAFRNYIRNKQIPYRSIQRNQEFLEIAHQLTEEFKATPDSEISNEEVVAIHVISSFQDLSRTFNLIYRNVTVILILAELPPPHIWEDLIEFFAQCGIPDVNERIHFINIREMNSGTGISHRLQCDMKSIGKIRRILQGRTAYIVPHADWFSERRLSVDLGMPIMGVIDTTMFQSRAAIATTFFQAQVVSLISTKEYTDVSELFEAGRQLMINNPDLTRWIIRYGFSQGESSIAWFDVTQDFYDWGQDIVEVVKANIHYSGNINKLFSSIKQFGGVLEAIPINIISFPTVSVFISTECKLNVIGTYDRMHYAPFKFGASLVPAISYEPVELIGHAKMVASELIKNGVLGYVNIDFITYNEENQPHLLGFDIRINSYPSILYSTYMTLCTGFNPVTGKMSLIRNVGDPNGKQNRYAVIQNSITHPGLSLMGMKDIRRTLYGQGIFFDLLQRTGFRFMLFDSPSEGKGFAIESATLAESAISLMEKSYSFLLKLFGVKAGSDNNSSLASGIISIRNFRSRIFDNSEKK